MYVMNVNEERLNFRDSGVEYLSLALQFQEKSSTLRYSLKTLDRSKIVCVTSIAPYKPFPPPSEAEIFS